VDRRVKILRPLEISAGAENIMMANKSIQACGSGLRAKMSNQGRE
jgi:hypothetical protein